MRITRTPVRAHSGVIIVLFLRNLFSSDFLLPVLLLLRRRATTTPRRVSVRRTVYKRRSDLYLAFETNVLSWARRLIFFWSYYNIHESIKCFEQIEKWFGEIVIEFTSARRCSTKNGRSRSGQSSGGHRRGIFTRYLWATVVPLTHVRGDYARVPEQVSSCCRCRRHKKTELLYIV